MACTTVSVVVTTVLPSTRAGVFASKASVAVLMAASAAVCVTCSALMSSWVASVVSDEPPLPLLLDEDTPVDDV